MSGTLSPDVIAAINQVAATPLGRKYDRIMRKRYGKSGVAVAAKTVLGESGGRKRAVSSAGARGLVQFMPATRDEYLKRYGVDAYGSAKEAIKAMELYQTGGKGLESYNPGMPTYAQYILSQKLDPSLNKALKRRGGSGTSDISVTTPTKTSVTLPTKTLPGQSFAAERTAARQSLLTSPGGLTLPKLLAYKSEINQLQDVPAQTVSGDLKVTRTGGKKVKIPGTSASASGGNTGKLGKVIISPAADRAGAKTNSKVVQFGEKVAGLVGHSLTLGTGTNHNQFVVGTNRQSAHWIGNAGDFPASGERLTKMGQAALIAAGMPPRKARTITGGLYNVGGYQIIFNTDEGGNHYNHLHIGLR